MVNEQIDLQLVRVCSRTTRTRQTLRHVLTRIRLRLIHMTDWQFVSYDQTTRPMTVGHKSVTLRHLHCP